MLPRRWRLTRDRDFQVAYRRGRRLRGHGFVLVVAVVPAAEPTRLAVVTSSRVDKRATRRNLLRRRTWAALRAQQAQIPNSGRHLIWLVQASAKDLSYADLAAEIARLLSKIP